MDKRGKVTNLVKKFNDRPIKKPVSSSKNAEPVKDQVATKPTSKKAINKNQDQDEISVSIDIGDDEIVDPSSNKPIIKTRSKKHLPSDTPPGNVRESNVSEFLEQQNTQRFESKPLLNTTFNTKGPIKDFNPNNNSSLSPWLSDRLSNLTSNIPYLKYRTLATDTFELDRRQDEEIRLLKEKIEDWECQSKIKDREIETYKWIEKEMQRRLQNTGDILSLRNQVKDLQRNLDRQERLNQEITQDNTRLYDEMSAKDRKVLELQSEVNNLDKVVTSKTIFQESEEHQKLLDQIDELRKELLDKQIEIKNNQQKINNLLREIEKQDKDLYLKNLKLDEKISELSQYKNDLAFQERNHVSLLDSIRIKDRENEMLLHNVRKVEDFERKWENLEDENLFLKQSLHDLEDQCKDLERRQETTHEAHLLLDELRENLFEKNRLKEDNLHLAEQLRMTESMLKEKSFQEIALYKENSQLKSFIMDLEEENGLYRKFENDVNELDSQLRDSEKIRNALENQLVQLKPQIQKLQVKSLEKDHLILQLVQELKTHIGYLPTDLRKEVSKNDVRMIPNDDGS